MGCNNLLQAETAWFSFPARTRADYEVKAVLLDRLDKFAYKFRTVAAVAVDEYDDIGASFKRGAHACPASSTVTSYWLAHHNSPCVLGGLSRGIRTSIVDDDDLIDDCTRYRANDFRNDLRFVQCGND